MSSKAIAMRPAGGAWTPLREEKDRSLLGVTGNDLGVWFATSDGAVLHLATTASGARRRRRRQLPPRDLGPRRRALGRDGDQHLLPPTPRKGSGCSRPRSRSRTTEVFDEIRGDRFAVWAVVAETGEVLRRNSDGEWFAAGPDDAVATVHLWSQDANWYATRWEP